MTNVNKINNKQKELLAQYMADHPNLAKNLIPNCGQGKVVAYRLWNELASKLNSHGPPVKEASAWRKVYADQKHNAKKKLSFNKESKRKTGGGPYEEKLLSPAEEQIIQAAGIEAAVEGISCIKTFGKPKIYDETVQCEEDILKELIDEDYIETEHIEIEPIDTEHIEKQTPRSYLKNPKAKIKLDLLKSSLSKTEKYHSELTEKFDKLIGIKEKSLKMKEEEHCANMAIKNIELQIKTIELEMLKKTKG